MAAQPIPSMKVRYFFRQFSFVAEGRSTEQVDVYPKLNGVYRVRYCKADRSTLEYQVIVEAQQYVIQKGSFDPCTDIALFNPPFTMKNQIFLTKNFRFPRISMALIGMDISSILTIALSIPFFGYQLFSKTKILTGRTALACNAIVAISTMLAIFSQFVCRDVRKAIAYHTGLKLFQLIQEAQTDPIMK